MNLSTQDIVIWIVFGAVIGWLASMIVGVGGNLIIYILVGIAGSFIGGWLVSRSSAPVPATSAGINWKSAAIALLGAIILCALIRVLG